MNTVDMGATLAPKSDQLNADDLTAGPRTITITSVRAHTSEQPIAIGFVGDNNKPYLPCKGMRRLIVGVWGADASQYLGRSMTLYRDHDVLWGGMKVGGIRISHMSHIETAQTMAITESKAKRRPVTVQPLVILMDATTLIEAYERAATLAVWEAIEADRGAAWKKIPTDDKPRVKAASDAAKVRISTTTEGQPE